MSRFAALETLRAATARALALGTARKALDVPAMFERASRNAGNASALGLLAAMALRDRFDRPSPPRGFAPAPPLPDASALVRGPLRVALRRVFHAQNRRDFDTVAVRVLAALGARGLVLHPFDYPALAPLMNADPELLDRAARAWRDARRSTAQSVQSGYAEIDAEGWTEFPPATRADFVRDLRARDPAAARELVAAAVGEDTAAVRGKLIAALGTGLSAEDVEYLQSLENDRAASVRQIAEGLLARLPGTAAFAERLARAEKLLRVRSGLAVGKRRVVEIRFPKGLSEGKRDQWVRDTFDGVSATGLARALKLKDKPFAAAVGASTLGEVLFASALLMEEYEMATLLAGEIEFQHWNIAHIGPDKLRDLSVAQAAVLWQCLTLQLPPLLTSVSRTLGAVYVGTRVLPPPDAAKTLSNAKNWRKWLKQTGHEGFDDPESFETLIALAPAAVRSEICEHLKGVAHAIGGRALALSELLDLIDQAGSEGTHNE